MKQLMQNFKDKLSVSKLELEKKVQGKSSTFNFDKIHKIIMICFAVATFVVSTSLNERGISKAMFSSPHMKSVAVMDSTRKHSGLVIKNTGLGPLVIKSIHVYDKQGNEIPNNSYDINTEFSDIIENKFLINPLQQGEAIGQNSEHWLLESKKNTPVESQMVRDFLYNMSISVCYCTANDSECVMKNIGLKMKPSMVNQCY